MIKINYSMIAMLPLFVYGMPDGQIPDHHEQADMRKDTSLPLVPPPQHVPALRQQQLRWGYIEEAGLRAADTWQNLQKPNIEPKVLSVISRVRLEEYVQHLDVLLGADTQLLIKEFFPEHGAQILGIVTKTIEILENIVQENISGKDIQERSKAIVRSARAEIEHLFRHGPVADDMMNKAMKNKLNSLINFFPPDM